MRGFIRLAAPCTAALILSSATPGPVRFESRPRAVATGTFPQIGVRVTGDVSLLTVEGGDLWYLTSPDGGDSFPQRVRVNETPQIEGVVTCGFHITTVAQPRSAIAVDCAG